jgi:hypothetical protein
MVERLIRCIPCNQLSPLRQFFEPPEGFAPLPGVEWANEDFANAEEFERRHGKHLREEIRVDPESFFSEKPSSEPNKVSYFEASNGRQRFLVKRTKGGLGCSAFYEIVPGQMDIVNIGVEIQDSELRKQISAEMDSTIFPEQRLQEFFSVLKEEMSHIFPHNLSEEVENIQEGESSLLAYASLKEAKWKKILDRCAREFRPSEIPQIRTFIQNNRQPGEVLSLMIHRRMSILPNASSQILVNQWPISAPS